jgi:hypothetical protein
MPDKTPDRRKPTRIDNATWQLFVKACGGLCCVCREDKKLHRGHIQRYADGGTENYENLIPVCKSCNSKYKGGFTPDGRPANWRDTFCKLFLTEMRVGIMCQHVQPCVNISLSDQPAEKNGFIDLQNVEFVLDYHLYKRDVQRHEPLSPPQAEKLVWALFDRSKREFIPPRRPNKKRIDAMKLLAIRHGHEAFWLGGEQFLREGDWISDEDRGITYQDSWQHFCDSFDKYLSDGKKRAVRLAEQAAVEREKDKVRKAEGLAHARQMTWNDYIRTADVPAWPGMSAGDAEFVAALAAEKVSANGLAQDVTDERHERSLAIYRRWKFYKDDELRAEKQKLRDRLLKIVQWSKLTDKDSQIAYADSIKAVANWIDREQSVEALRNNAYELLGPLELDLDPDQRCIENCEDFIELEH